jgi:hypothetical protein
LATFATDFMLISWCLPDSQEPVIFEPKKTSYNPALMFGSIIFSTFVEKFQYAFHFLAAVWGFYV